MPVYLSSLRSESIEPRVKTCQNHVTLVNANIIKLQMDVDLSRKPMATPIWQQEVRSLSDYML